MAEFCMPSLGSDMEDGIMVEWEKHVGDTVHRGDVIAVVETQKGAIEIEVFDDGVIEKILVQVGEQVPVGTPLAMIGTHPSSAQLNLETPTVGANTIAINQSLDESIDTGSKSLTSSTKTSIPITEHHSTTDALNRTTQSAEQVSPADSQRLRVTPVARQLALKENIDLATVVGTGVGSAIVLDDVRAAIAQAKPIASSSSGSGSTAKEEYDKIKADPKTLASPMEGMRAAIAAAMSHSKREIPHYYLSHTIEVDNAQGFISATNSDRLPEERIVLGAMLIKSVALAVKQYPEFNGFFENDTFTASNSIHIGMAINLRGGGLVAPAIHSVNNLSLFETMAALKDLVNRVRKQRFKASELNDPTLTISSLGERGVDSLYGVIYPPQVAIVGFGTPTKSLQMRNQEIVQINTVTVTLAADHRVSDGHRGALFLRAIAQYLQTPEKL